MKKYAAETGDRREAERRGEEMEEEEKEEDEEKEERKLGKCARVELED